MQVKLAEKLGVDSEVLEAKDYQNKQSHCLGCGDVLRRFSLLVCAECLGDECRKFLELTQEMKE